MLIPIWREGLHVVRRQTALRNRNAYSVSSSSGSANVADPADRCRNIFLRGKSDVIAAQKRHHRSCQPAASIHDLSTRAHTGSTKPKSDAGADKNDKATPHGDPSGPERRGSDECS